MPPASTSPAPGHGQPVPQGQGQDLTPWLSQPRAPDAVVVTTTGLPQGREQAVPQGRGQAVPLGQGQAVPLGRGQAGRSRRADAQRNHDLLLAAAREVFSEHGADAPLDEIARRAGIGNATMYRHFPDRRELLIAVYADEVAALCAQGETLLEDQSPEDALFVWLRAFIAHVATKRDLALAIPGDQGGQRSALFDRWHKAMHATASKLLSRAKSASAVSADLNASDLLALANGIAVASADTDQAERCLELIRHGTAPSHATRRTRAR